MSAIMQGTTPTLRIRIKASDFAVGEVAILRLVFNNKGVITKKTLNDVTVDTAQNAFLYTFTERETFAFSPQTTLYYSGRAVFPNGAIVGIKQKAVEIVKNDDDEVLSDAL